MSRRRGVADGGGLALVALVLLAITLRGPVSSVGPLLEELRVELRLGVAAALLPALPLLCFGLLAPAAPALARAIGLHRAVLAGLAVLVTGLVVRSIGVPGLFAGTLLVGAGIAVINVLLPAVVKADFADRPGLAMALATSSIALSASIGAGLAQPVREAIGGPLLSLGLWLVPGLLALAAWLPLARRRQPVPPPGATGVVTLLQRPVGLAVTAFFGLQSLAFYTLLAWLPSMLRAAGVSAAQAGAMLAVAAFLGAPASFIVPRLAARRPSQERLVLGVAVPMVLGLTGLLVAPGSAPWVWSVLLGLGTGASFPLAMSLILLRSRDSAQAARLSAAAQGAGYLLASFGPFVVGIIREATGTWTASLLLMLGLLALQVAVGISAARDRLATG